MHLIMATGPDLITTIEETTGRRIGINFTLEQASGQYLSQPQSRLFSLPPIIRARILTLALSPEHIPNVAFYRPSYTADLYTDTRPLLTGRQFFLEARHLPMRLSEHSFFHGYSPAPKAKGKEWMRKLTRHNRENFGILKVYAPMYVFKELTDKAGS